MIFAAPEYWGRFFFPTHWNPPHAGIVFFIYLMRDFPKETELSIHQTHFMALSPFAGRLPDPSMLVNIPALITAYYTGVPDPSDPDQRIAFGTSDRKSTRLNS